MPSASNFSTSLSDLSHVRLDDGADAAAISRQPVQFVDEVERALGVGRAFHVNAREVWRLHGGGFGHQADHQIARQLFIHVKTHVGKFETDVGVEPLGGDFVEQLVIKLRRWRGPRRRW